MQLSSKLLKNSASLLMDLKLLSFAFFIAFRASFRYILGAFFPIFIFMGVSK